MGALLALGGPAFAQDEDQPAPAAQRMNPDLSFATTLGYDMQPGWYDLAFDVLDQLDASRAPAEVKEDAKLLRIQLRTKWATGLKDKNQRDAEQKKIQEDLQALAGKG